MVEKTVTDRKEEAMEMFRAPKSEQKVLTALEESSNLALGAWMDRKANGRGWGSIDLDEIIKKCDELASRPQD